jgi:hypothetical protein
VGLSFVAAVAIYCPVALAAAWLAVIQPRSALNHTAEWISAVRPRSALASAAGWVSALRPRSALTHASGWLAGVRPRIALAPAAGWLAAMPRPRGAVALETVRLPLLWACLASLVAVLAILAYRRAAVSCPAPPPMPEP